MARLHSFAALMIFALLTAAAVAQKPDPPTLDGSAPPPVRGAKAAPQPINTQPPGPDVGAFIDAYERAGEPPILIIVGLDNRVTSQQEAAKAQGQTATSTLSDTTVRGSELTLDTERHIGRNVTLFNPTGDPQKLKTDIEEILLLNRDLELVDIDALAERDRRELKILWLRNERRAMELLNTKLNAEVILLVRMIDSGAVQARGARYRVLVSMLEVSRGRKIGGFSFDWMRNTDSRTVKRYAQEITRKFIDQFSYWYAPAGGGTVRPYTVRIIGLENVAQLRQARDAFESIAGVSKVRVGSSTSDGRQSIATLKVKYAGRLLDLVYDLQETARSELAMKVDATDAVTGSVTLLAEHEQQRQRWMQLMDTDDPDHGRLRKGFRQEYQDEGSPKIGIMVNRELTDEEKNKPELAEKLARLLEGDAEGEEAERLRELLRKAAGGNEGQDAGGEGGLGGLGGGEGEGGAVQTAKGGGDGVFVAINFVGGSVQGGDGNAGGNTPAVTPATPGQTPQQREAEVRELLNTRRVENAVYKRFIKAGLTMVDPNYVRARLAKDAEKARRIYNEEELPWLLGQEAGLDIVILGRGRISRSGRGTSITYTFRAVRVSDGITLAADLWSGDLTVGSEREVDQLIEQIADYAAGNLMDQMWTHWQPPRLLAVMLHNAKTQKDVIAVMNVFKTTIPGVVAADFVKHEAGREGGIGMFNVRYDTTYEKMIEEIADREDRLPFDLDKGGTTRDTLTIRIRDEF